MKTVNLKTLKPSTNEFFSLVNGKISETGKQSAAWKTVYSLFQTAQRIYRTLNDMTYERLSVFVSSKSYLTPLQERDLTALTAQYLSQLDMQMAREIVQQDTSITDAEREILLAAIEMYRSSVAATCSALGNPRWVEES